MTTPIQTRISISMLLMMSIMFLATSAFGQQSPEFEILCPPNDGTSSGGGFSNEPLKQDLKTGQVSRLTSVERAIAFKACDQDVAINDLAEAVSTITCIDSQKNGTETDVDCGGLCPDKCPTGDACLVNADCVSDFCSANLVCEN